MSTPDFFRSRLDQMIDLRHPLVVLSKRLPWASLEAAGGAEAGARCTACQAAQR